ncbi:MAG: tRNA dihydrouridine(20/20a) synthase DusA, partial [Litoreibacter sp.]|nr:tRNA dihydrouridine(20/20a) synthase DusA [Litoreibacter sp.]
DQDPEVVLPDFLAKMRDAGVGRVAIHARKAWLQGLSPKENRDIPPLDYDLVHAMKARFPELQILLNGGVTSLDQAEAALEAGLDGVMMGRAAYHAPCDVLLEADQRIFGLKTPVKTPHRIVREMVPYIEAHLEAGGRLHQVTRHMLGLFAGRPGARIWRRMLSENAHREDASAALVLEALAQVPESDLQYSA